MNRHGPAPPGLSDLAQAFIVRYAFLCQVCLIGWQPQVWNSRIRRANWQTSCLWSFAYIYIYVLICNIYMCNHVCLLSLYLSIYICICIYWHTHTPIRWYSTFSQLHRWSQWVTAPLSGWTFPWHLWQMSWRTENLSSDRCSVGKAETDADSL